MNAFKVATCLAGLEISRCAGSVSAQSFSVPPKDSHQLEWWRASMTTHDQRMSWWRDARFGMFVHWGVYSTLGNEYQGRRSGTYSEHDMSMRSPSPNCWSSFLLHQRAVRKDVEQGFERSPVHRATPPPGKLLRGLHIPALMLRSRNFTSEGSGFTHCAARTNIQFRERPPVP